MGLDTTTTHLVWFVAIVTVAGSVSHALISTAERLQEARDARDGRLLEKLDTKLGSAIFCYNTVLQRLNATAVNLGSALDASEVTLVADGVVVPGQNVNVWAASGQSVWRHGEFASWNKSPVTPEPTRVVIYAGNGVATIAAPSYCPEITSIVVTPSSATIGPAGTQDFEAQAYDQLGVPMHGFVFSWSATTGTISSLNETRARLTAGTVAGSYSVTASYGGIAGGASVTVMAGPPVSMTVAPDPVSVVAGGSQQFTATMLDQHGNQNTTATITWSTTAGSVSSSGLLTAQTLAQAGRSVTATWTTVSDSAAVDVVPAPLHHVTVTPTTASVLTGSASAYSAQGYDQHENAISGLAYSWSSWRGSVTQAGVYTAPSTTGTDYVNATADGVTGSSTITVQRSLHVQAMATYGGGVPDTTFGFNDAVETRVTIRDHTGAAVSGATVRLVLTDSAGAQVSNTTATANAGGMAFFNHTIAPGSKKGTWNDEVMTLAGTNMVYDPTANVVRLITFTVN